MQKVKIDVYISDLLYSYDCVIVPDFGGFVANYASAKIQPIQHRFTPPSKHISFNKNLRVNDGLLTSHIAQRKSIAYDEAKELIQAFVSQSIEGLKQGDKIKIEKVGTLYLDPEQNIQFIAEEKNDFLLDSYGMTSFRAEPIVREGAEERLERKIKENLPLIKEEEKKKRKYYWPAAAVLFFLIASSLFLNTQFSWVDEENLQFSSFKLGPEAEATYTAKTNEFKLEGEKWKGFPEAISFEETIAPLITSDGDKTAAWVDNRKEDLVNEEDNTAVEAPEIRQQLRFHVMGGCFSNYSNAEGLVQSLKEKGFEARLLGEYKNLHAVSYASFATRKEALELLAEVKANENNAAWLLVKPF